MLTTPKRQLRRRSYETVSHNYKTLKNQFILLLLFLASFVTNAQIKRRNLLGEWTINNKDSLYFKLDTLELIQDANHSYGLATCHLILWQVEKFKFSVKNSFLCTEPRRIINLPGKQRLTLSKQKEKQIIRINGNFEIRDTFVVLAYQEKEVNRYPWEVKTLKLKRIKNKSG